MNLYLLKYRLQHNDVEMKNKIKFTTIFALILLFIPTFIILNPFIKLKNILESKKSNIPYYTSASKIAVTNTNISNVTLPISGTITSGYGYRIDPISGKYSKHTGIDISGLHHDNVRSIESGTVTFAGSQNGYGYCVEINHGNYYSFYAHLSKIYVNVNSNVNKGDVIGIEGGDPRTDPNPGYSTGHHLHFEIREKSGYGNDINPTNYINKKI